MHYCRDEWRAFRLHRVAPDIREAMVEHLAACKSCFDAYISAVEESDEELADIILSPGFAEGVARRVRAMACNTNNPTRARRPAPSALQNYVMAAAVTLVLLGAGWFDILPSAIPLTVERAVSASGGIEVSLPAGWASGFSDRIARYLTGLAGRWVPPGDPASGGGRAK